MQRPPLEQALKDLLQSYPMAMLSGKRLSLGNQEGESKCLHGTISLDASGYDNKEGHAEVLAVVETMKSSGVVRFAYVIEFDELPEKNLLLEGLGDLDNEKS